MSAVSTMFAKVKDIMQKATLGWAIHDDFCPRVEVERLTPSQK